MEYIRQNVETINLRDPGNKSNNVLSDVATHKRRQLANTLRNLLNSIAHDPQALTQYFPEN